MKLTCLKTALTLMIAGALLTGAVQARTSYDGEKPAKTKIKKTRTLLRDDPDPYLHGSRETVKQRDRRLSRECRGGVNAGACAGYTR